MHLIFPFHIKRKYPYLSVGCIFYQIFISSFSLKKTEILFNLFSLDFLAKSQWWRWLAYRFVEK